MKKSKGRSRRLQLDICKVSLPKLKKLSPHALNKVWNRIDKGTPRNRVSARPLRALAAWASNYAAAKTSVQVYRGGGETGKLRSHAVRMYLKIARKLEGEFKAARARSCSR